MRKISTMGLLILLNTTAINLSAQNSFFGLLVDGSRSSAEAMGKITSQNVADFLWSEFNIDPNGFSGEAITMVTGQIGEFCLPELKKIELASQNWLFSSTEKRMIEIEDFKSGLDSSIASLFTEFDDGGSNIFRSMVSVLNEFPKGSDTPKTLICFSDFIESNSVVNMEVFSSNPKALMESYESIKESLLADLSIPASIEGCKVILVCPQANDLSLNGARFFSQLLSEFGADVTIRAAL